MVLRCHKNRVWVHGRRMYPSCTVKKLLRFIQAIFKIVVLFQEKQPVCTQWKIKVLKGMKIQTKCDGISTYSEEFNSGKFNSEKFNSEKFNSEKFKECYSS